MRSIEKIYNRLFSVGKLTLETVVTNGAKNASDMRLDAFKYDTFKSNKYSNVDTLDQLRINSNAYLSVSYKGYNENNEFENEEVWIAEKYIGNFKDFLVSAYEQIIEKQSEIYGKNSVNPEYEDFIITTGYDEEGNGFGFIDGNGHTIYMYPEMLAIQGDDDTKTLYQGVVFVIETKDAKQYAIEMGLKTLYNMSLIVNNYDMTLDARLTSIMGLLYQSASGSSSGSVKASNTNVRPSGLSRPLKSRNGGTSPVAPAAAKPTSVKKPSLENALDDMEEDLDEEETTAPAPKAAPAKGGKKIISKKPVTKTTKSVSINDMLNEADDVDVDIDLDEEGEDF